jgi:hypothetical protein
MNEPEIDTGPTLPQPDEVVEQFSHPAEEDNASTSAEEGKKYDGGAIPRQ